MSLSDSDMQMSSWPFIQTRFMNEYIKPMQLNFQAENYWYFVMYNNNFYY